MSASHVRRGLSLQHGDLTFPVFLPDATRAVVRSIDSADLESCGVPALVMSTFHLMQVPGSSTIQSAGGLHRFTGWNRPIVTDSGGFQIYSLLRQNAKYGSVNEKGMIYRGEDGEKVNLTPEKSIQLQLSYGADIVFCLDDCTHVDENPAEQQVAVNRTVKWAKRCREEFDRIVSGKGYTEANRPLLFGIVQGGGSRELRKQCADQLLEIGFDGYGYGGFPIDSDGNLLQDMVSYTREIIPPQFPMHALGIGHPYNVVDTYRAGYDIFDSALPTRDARKGRLYTFKESPETWTKYTANNWLSYIYIEDKKHIKNNTLLGDLSDHPVSGRYTVSYLHHLYKIGDALYMRLATIHNLSIMARLMARLKEIYVDEATP